MRGNRTTLVRQSLMKAHLLRAGSANDYAEIFQTGLIWFSPVLFVTLAYNE